MKYHGIYGRPAIERCIEVAKNFIRENDYYSKQNRSAWILDEEEYGAFIDKEFMIQESSRYEGWGDYYIPDYGWVEEIDNFDPPAEWFAGKTIGWKTCAGNQLSIYFHYGLYEVEVVAEGRRHGIPRLDLLKEIDKYLIDVKKYETQCPEWKPWENLHTIKWTRME